MQWNNGTSSRQARSGGTRYKISRDRQDDDEDETIPCGCRAINAFVRTMTTRKTNGAVALLFFFAGFVLFRPVSSEQENAEGTVPRRSCSSYVAAVVIPNQYEFDLYYQQYVKDGGKDQIYATTEMVAGRKVHKLECYNPDYALDPVIRTIKNNPCFVAVVSGLGLVNGAMASQMLLSRYAAENLLVAGIAGSTNGIAAIDRIHNSVATAAAEQGASSYICECDVVIPSSWAVTDLQVWTRNGASRDDPIPLEEVDYTRQAPAEPFEHCPVDQRGLIWTQPSHLAKNNGDVEKGFFMPVDDRLLRIAQEVASHPDADSSLLPCRTNKVFPFCGGGGHQEEERASRIVVGTTNGGSANTFLANGYRALWLLRKYNISVVEMETAAAAQVAYTNGIPYLGIRGISDNVNADVIDGAAGNLTSALPHIDHAQTSMRNAAAVLDGMLRRLCREAADLEDQQQDTSSARHYWDIRVFWSVHLALLLLLSSLP